MPYSIFESSTYDILDLLGDMIMMIPDEDRTKFVFGILLKLIALVGFNLTLLNKALEVMIYAQTRRPRSR